MEKKKTLPGSWKASLSQLLKQIVEPGSSSKVAVIAIGNHLRSDDAAGILVAQKLMESRIARDQKHVLVMDAGHAPENMTVQLRHFAPASVLLVDAADMGQLSETVHWIPMEDLDGMSASTHSMPLSMLARYLTLELHCTVSLLGIQPRSNDFGEIISTPVLQAIDDTVTEIDESIHCGVVSRCGQVVG